MTALAARWLEPSAAPSRDHPYRARQLTPLRSRPMRPASLLRRRFASDRDLVGLKIGLLVGLSLLLAACEFVV